MKLTNVIYGLFYLLGNQKLRKLIGKKKGTYRYLFSNLKKDFIIYRRKNAEKIGEYILSNKKKRKVLYHLKGSIGKNLCYFSMIDNLPV